LILHDLDTKSIAFFEKVNIKDGCPLKPYIHAKNSTNKYGGTIEDYLPIHNFLDSSKAHVADMRHRAILHSSFGCYIAEQIFGVCIKNKDGAMVSVRDVCEDHIIEDMGTIPAVKDYLEQMPFYDWLGGPRRDKRTFSLNDGTMKRVD